MRYLHTMLRVKNLDESLRFYTEGLHFKILSKNEYPEGKFTLVFLSAPGDEGRQVCLELTYNWDQSDYIKGDAYGHMAYLVESISLVEDQLKRANYSLSWGPGPSPSGKAILAFVDDPDGYEIELIQNN